MPNRRAQEFKREVAVQRLIGNGKKSRRRMPRQIVPSAIERDYARHLARVARRTRLAIRPLLAELPALMRSARAEIRRTDAALRDDAGEPERLRELVAQALATAQLPDDGLAQLSRDFAARTATHQRIQMDKQTRAVFGVDVFAGDGNLRIATEAFVAENVQLITALPTRTLGEIEGIVLRGASSGRLHTDIAKEIQNRLRVQANKAKLIARDQVGKFYSAVNATRHQAMGVTEFIWSTVGDERVREEHSAIDGQKFKYPGGAPGEGLPGEPILCRCFADPVFDDLLG